MPISRPICEGSIWIVWIRGANCEELLARRLDDLGHLAEDERARLFGLRERVAQDVEGDARDLDVHLQRGDPALGAGDLEVHVAEVVLHAGAQPDTSLTAQDGTPRLGLAVKPNVQESGHANHDPAVLTVTDSHRPLP